MPKSRVDRWKMETPDLIDECEELEKERDDARSLCRVYRAALRGDHAAAAVLALVAEANNPWLDEDEPTAAKAMGRE